MKNIDRRNFIRKAGLGSLAIGIPVSTVNNVRGTYRETLVYLYEIFPNLM